MNKYNLGKIYELVCNSTGLKYIGSTTETMLSKRLAGHVSAYKRWSNGTTHYVSSFEIIKGGDYYINLLELCCCSCKDELLKYEREWISQTVCVNKVKNPYLSIEGKLEYQKEYQKVYILNHKEEKKEYDKVYQINNKEAILEQKKEYYQKCVKTICGCGGYYNSCDKSKHLATKKHTNWIILNDVFEKKMIIEEDKELVYEELKHLEVELEVNC